MKYRLEIQKETVQQEIITVQRHSMVKENGVFKKKKKVCSDWGAEKVGSSGR